jgi:hypothetical protein
LVFPGVELTHKLGQNVIDVVYAILKLHHASILPEKCQQWNKYGLGTTYFGGGTSLYWQSKLFSLQN